MIPPFLLFFLYFLLLQHNVLLSIFVRNYYYITIFSQISRLWVWLRDAFFCAKQQRLTTWLLFTLLILFSSHELWRDLFYAVSIYSTISSLVKLLPSIKLLFALRIFGMNAKILVGMDFHFSFISSVWAEEWNKLALTFSM